MTDCMRAMAVMALAWVVVGEGAPAQVDTAAMAKWHEFAREHAALRARLAARGGRVPQVAGQVR